MENRKAWTAHGTMHPLDQKVIYAVSQENLIASRIFVTGEVDETYIDDTALKLLININNTMYDGNLRLEPLFVQTKRHTIKMTRFVPEFVWKCFNPDVLVEKVKDEADRLGVKLDPWAMDRFDFYESMIASLRAEKGDFMLPTVHKASKKIDDFYNAIYLTCLLLFNKPYFMDIPVQEHFSDVINAQHLSLARYRELDNDQKAEVEKLREKYGSIQALTNPELDFIVDLFVRSN